MRKFIRKVSGRYEITATAKWVPLTSSQIAQEYEWEYLPHVKPKFGNFWSTLDDFKHAIKRGTVISLTKEKDESVDYRSRCESLEELKDLTSSYRYPRDADSIVKGLKSSDPMPYPIILKDKSGNLRVMSGNTRLDAAFILGIIPKVLIVQVPDEVTL